MPVQLCSFSATAEGMSRNFRAVKHTHTDLSKRLIIRSKIYIYIWASIWVINNYFQIKPVRNMLHLSLLAHCMVNNFGDWNNCLYVCRWWVECVARICFSSSFDSLLNDSLRLATFSQWKVGHSWPNAIETLSCDHSTMTILHYARLSHQYAKNIFHRITNVCLELFQTHQPC